MPAPRSSAARVHWAAALAGAIVEATGQRFEPRTHEPAGGGSISQSFVLHGEDGRKFFVKRNESARRAMFEAEAAGLAELARCGALTVPRVIARVDHGTDAFLVLEHLELGGRASGAELGRAVAALHRIRGESFGWRSDNFIGSTPQPNTPASDWVCFYREHRLAHQRRLAQRNGGRAAMLDAVARLEQGLSGFFGAQRPRPALLHGDLWSGNWGFTPQGRPAVFDPAVYFGDREADIAMMQLFGDPGPDFFAAYGEHLPLPPEYAYRRELYNLYHVLNHFNLFGGSYGHQAESMARRLLAELG